MAFVSDALTKNSTSPTQLELDLIDVVKSSGLYLNADPEYFTKFNRYGYINPYTRVTGVKEYLFFTKPDLHIFNGSSEALNSELSNMPIFVDALDTHKTAMKQLQFSADAKSSPFINLLCNSKRSNLDIPGISTSNDIETSSNMYGSNMTYRGSSYSADEDFEFSIEFEDTQNLDVYMFFKLFDEYERKKLYGVITPPDGYTDNKILHDQFSIFKIITTEDASTILFFAKLYGCYPKGVPREVFSDMPESGEIRFSVPFHGSFIEDSEPNIVGDFNELSSKIVSSGSFLKPYSTSLGGINGDWASAPYIDTVAASKDRLGRKRYKLMWR